jgi:hypothetical protein
MSIHQEHAEEAARKANLIEHFVLVEKGPQFNYITNMTGAICEVEKLTHKAEFMLADYPVGTSIFIQIKTPRS